MQGQALTPQPGCKVYRYEVRISELADRVGVPTSTVRYYERVGLLAVPARTASGYRDYDEDDGRPPAVRHPGAADGPELRADQRPAADLGRRATAARRASA